jgi:hypothetical protein
MEVRVTMAVPQHLALLAAVVVRELWVVLPGLETLMFLETAGLVLQAR